MANGHEKSKVSIVEPWNRDDVPWKNEPQFWNYVRGNLRKALWNRSPIKIALKKAAAKPAPATSRAKTIIKCEFCMEWFPASKIEVDHIEPCGKLNSWDSLQPFITKMIRLEKGGRMLCKPCHKIQTYAERHNMTFNTAKYTKEAINITKKPAKEVIEWMKKESIWKKECKNAKERRKIIVQYLNNKKR